MDSNISDVIITGDFNLNVMKQHEFRKIESLCNEYNMIQCIDKPTHFTENSISTTDLLFVTIKYFILTTGCGEPCLGLTMRHHCLIFVFFISLNQKLKIFIELFGNMSKVITMNLEIVLLISIGIL